MYSPQVDETPFRKENNMTTGRHSVPINLRFDIDDSLGVGFEPCNIDFYIEMSDATKYY